MNDLDFMRLDLLQTVRSEIHAPAWIPPKRYQFLIYVVEFQNSGRRASSHLQPGTATTLQAEWRRHGRQ
jgi:hypothetical protein